jgi:hypothetical protein
VVSLNEKYSFDDDLKKVGETKSDLSKVTEILLNEKWRRRKTILRDRVISALATLETISKIWDVEFLQQWIPYYCEYLTSSGGKGRQDIVDITKFSIDRENQREENIMSMMGRHR